MKSLELLRQPIFSYARIGTDAGFCTLPYAGQFALRAHDPSDKVASTALKISSFFMKLFVRLSR